MNDSLHLREIISYVALVGGAVLVLWSKVKTDNLKDLKDRVEILEKERDYARNQHIENQKAIANLEGQLQTYKEIPLKSIAHSLQVLPDLVESNNAILQTLQGSATTLADEKKAQGKGGLLVKTTEENPLDVKVTE